MNALCNCRKLAHLQFTVGVILGCIRFVET